MKGPWGAQAADPAVVADGRADGRHARRDRRREPLRHARLVGGHELQVRPAAHGLPRAGVHERARPDLVDGVLLLKVAARRVDDRAPHRRASVALLDRLHLPVVGRARHVQPAQEHPLEGVQRPEQETRHDVGPELLLELDGCELDASESQGSRSGWSWLMKWPWSWMKSVTGTRSGIWPRKTAAKRSREFTPPTSVGQALHDLPGSPAGLGAVAPHGLHLPGPVAQRGGGGGVGGHDEAAGIERREEVAEIGLWLERRVIADHDGDAVAKQPLCAHELVEVAHAPGVDAHQAIRGQVVLQLVVAIAAVVQRAAAEGSRRRGRCRAPRTPGRGEARGRCCRHRRARRRRASGGRGVKCGNAPPIASVRQPAPSGAAPSR